jgi:hypothetical protein
MDKQVVEKLGWLPLVTLLSRSILRPFVLFNPYVGGVRWDGVGLVASEENLTSSNVLHDCMFI